MADAFVERVRGCARQHALEVAQVQQQLCTVHGALAFYRAAAVYADEVEAIAAEAQTFLGTFPMLPIETQEFFLKELLYAVEIFMVSEQVQHELFLLFKHHILVAHE